MVDRVVSGSPSTKAENMIAMICILFCMALLAFALMGDLFVGAGGKVLLGILIAANLAPPVIARVMRRRRKGALLEFVMPRDRHGDRRVDPDAFQALAAEYRAIEETDFRTALARAVTRDR